VLAFSSNIGCEVPSHIRVFRGAAYLLLSRCMFRPREGFVSSARISVFRIYIFT
jgi:hypothetical protein